MPNVFCPFIAIARTGGGNDDYLRADDNSCVGNECAMWVEWYEKRYTSGPYPDLPIAMDAGTEKVGGCGLVHRVVRS